MQITVHYSTKTGTIKQAFNRMFPFLKIEFLKTANAKIGIEPGKNMVLHNRYVGEINGGLRSGSISITGDYKAGSLEQLFQQNFGLPVQVFRKQKKIWIEATAEELTLFQQNEKGKESCISLVLGEEEGFKHGHN